MGTDVSEERGLVHQMACYCFVELLLHLEGYTLCQHCSSLTGENTNKFRVMYSTSTYIKIHLFATVSTRISNEKGSSYEIQTTAVFKF